MDKPCKMPGRKILLLNPPADDRIIRDYYCSKISKGYYYPPPIDLLIQSGMLASEFDLVVIDAIIENIPAAECQEKIVQADVDGVVSLVGAATFDRDMRFLAEMYSRYEKAGKFLPILVSGENFLEKPGSYLERFQFISGIVLDFTTDSTRSFFNNDFENITDLAFKKDFGKDSGRPAEIITNKSPKTSDLKIPLPRHDLFIQKNYRYPYMTASPLATVLTEYGCPYRCSFCIMQTLGVKYRPVEDVIREFSLLKRYNARYIYFSDQTFGSKPERNRQLLRDMISHDFAFRWCCFSRVDVMTPSVLELMKKAGCETIMFGVETASERLLAEYNKDIDLDQVKETFAVAKKLGLRRMGTFIIGFPEEDEQSIAATIKLIRDLDCDYISLNIAVPRSNTAFREKAIDYNLIDGQTEIMDQSGQTIAMPTRTVSRKRIMEYKNMALKTFYLDPGYLAKRLLAIRTFTELKTHALEGFCVLQNILRS